MSALHGEAFAFARYTFFAEQARREGDARTAQMFDGIAAVELREHFVELAELVGLSGAEAHNLQAAIQDESAEVEETYLVYAAQARAAGERAVAERFDELRLDELEHLRTLESALERLEVPA
jgi:rubrerythrin